MKNYWFFLVFGLLICSCDSSAEKGISDGPSKSWSFSHFDKVDSLNPILKPSSGLNFTDPIENRTIKWEERNVLNPTAIVKDNKVYLLYRAQDSSGTSRIGLAISEDGLTFTKQPEPIFFPERDHMLELEWNYQKFDSTKIERDQCKSCYFDGVEDPRIIEGPEGIYLMTYTAYDGKTARLSIASTKDLVHWTKHGLVLKEEAFKDHWSKAGAIVGELIDNRIVAKKIDGKYWMYFGDTNLYMATSDDLINWTLLKDKERGHPISVLHPRPGFFDSRLVEPGPYALYKDDGIVLIYNSSNAENLNDPELPKFTYAAGQALFDKDKPFKLIDRESTYFIHPDKDYEKVGEVNEVCFVEGLVYFKDKWYLYYGTADSKIAVAINQ